ncbi:MAG: uracil-DNA glycosylase [Rhodoferax sp.]|nr:uracil-DNA glycosylase [Rhodoferax sp.]
MFGSDRLARWSPADWPIAQDWRPVVSRFLGSRDGARLGDFLQERLAQGAVVFPAQPLRALQMTPRAKVRVVIFGQDPYHATGQANGLAFSVPQGVRPPPSLHNILGEIARDPLLQSGAPQRPRGESPGGDLVAWAHQGVLLLNICLTVEQGQPASHAGRGWEVLTDAIVEDSLGTDGPVVFLLWGAHAQKKRAIVQSSGRPQTLVLCANHPSPLSARRGPTPFVGCGHFGQANVFLRAHGARPVAW